MPNTNRRTFLARAAGIGCGSIAVFTSFQLLARAKDESNPEITAAELLTTPTVRAIDKGLSFLASRQREDGSFGSGGYSYDVGVCSLCGMAFLSSGSTPGRGPYGKQIDKCIDFVLDNVDQSGFINVAGTKSHGPMYGHGFSALFLAECYGMTRRNDIREKLTRAVQLIIETQNHEGGLALFAATE